MKSIIPVVCLLCVTLLLPSLAVGVESPTYQQQADLSVKVARLEQVVASLQQQIAQLQSIIRINGTTVEISSSRDLKIKAAGAIDINSGMNTVISSGMNTDIKSGMSSDIKSGLNTTIKSGATTDIYAGAFLRLQGARGEISASSDLLLKGGLLRLNKGNKPIATMGSMVSGNQVITGTPTILGE